jgi:hypothetical protein
MTGNDRSTVVAVFEMRSEADAAIHELQEAGFRDDQIGFMVRNNDKAAPVIEEADAGAGPAAGAVSGGIIGGVVGAAAALLVPGVGPAIAGGILIATLGGIVFGAAAGGILGALMDQGVPEEEARYYEGEFSSGRTIVMVQAAGRQQEATTILHHNGGYDAGTRFVQVPAPALVATGAAPSNTEAQAGNTGNQQNTGFEQETNVSPVQQQASTSNMVPPPTPPEQVQEQQISQPVTANSSPREYDPITGVTGTAQNAPVNAAGNTMGRDPTVETDETAGTDDTQVRPDTVVDEGANESIFERPVEPGTVQPGGMNDPNNRLPRIP